MEPIIFNKASTLQTYQREVEQELQNILAFWKRFALDERNGGFVGKMDNAGVVSQNAPKGGILNARILWTFSAAFRHSNKEEHLLLAKRSFNFLLDHFLDKEFGGIYWSVDAQGKPENTRKQIYALAFAIYGLSEYYLASGEERALEVAKELFGWIESHSFDKGSGGYFEAFSWDGKLLDDLRLSPKDRNDPKTMNTHLHILEAYANLYRAWPDELLARQLEGLIETFLQHIIDPETHHLKLFLTKDWVVTADLISFGHDIEAAWLLLEAAEVLGKKELTEKVAEVSVQMAKAATEGLQPDGSLFHELDKSSHHSDKHREWWVSAEAMVGFLNAYQLTGDESFLIRSLDSWEFAKKHLLDKQNGEWFWGVHNDYGLMSGEDKIGFWKCPYHNGRACMEVSNRSKSLLKT